MIRQLSTLLAALFLFGLPAAETADGSGLAWFDPGRPEGGIVPAPRGAVTVKVDRNRKTFRIPGRFYGSARCFSDIESNGKFRSCGRKRRFVLRIMRIGVDVLRQGSVGKGILRQFVLPGVFIQKPPAERVAFFLRRGRQIDRLLSRGFYRADELCVVIKRDRIRLRRGRFRMTAGKKAHEQKQAQRHAYNRDKLFFRR